MSGAGEGGASFDPRTWSGAQPQPAAPSPAPAAAQPSFDVRSWAGGKPEPDAAAEPAAPAQPAAARPAGPPRPLLLASLAVLVALGGGLAWLAANRPQPEAPPVQVAAPAKPTDAPPVRTAAAGGLERLTLNVAGLPGLRSALAASGVPSPEANAALAVLPASFGQAGELRVALLLQPLAEGASLQRLEVRTPAGEGAAARATGAGAFAAEALASDVTTAVRVVRGEMDAESFYSSAVAAGVVDELIGPFAQAFTFDFDFQREIAPGDIFEAAFEQSVNAAGDPVGAPKLLFAQLETREKSKALYRFTPPGEEAGWFDGAGRSIVRTLMRTPVEGARISSKFGFRKHPILGYQKLHKGTDFAAPTGTPIYAAGDAVVEVASPRGAAGNFVSLRHDNGWRTTYMHLNAFAPGLAPGQRIGQGQTIGEVGTTGRSTGPHLHFEVWIDGQPVDSMTITTEAGRSLDGEALAAFVKERDRIDLLRAQQTG